ncbi:MAG TPA: ABC transporter permease [Thermoleophilia bacterium]|nr:ABC transporter permease [Thermoleophilia bacterium]
MTVIEAKKGWAALRLGELWPYRELLYFLTWRDIKVRYKQAVLGIAWAVVQPVLTMVVFTVVFNRYLGVQPPSGVPYAVFSFVGLLPWTLFSSSLSRSSGSLVGSSGLLTKVYFPRLVIPSAGVLGALPDFVISFAVLLGLMAYYNMYPGWQVVFLPPLLALALATAFAFGLWLSALNVLYRDVGYVIPFLVQIWMYMSPVAYPPPEHGPLRIVFGLNPMSGVIQGFRWALIGGEPPSRLLMVAVVLVALVLVFGLFYFKRMERIFADVV